MERVVREEKMSGVKRMHADMSTQTDDVSDDRELLKDVSRCPTWNEFSRNQAVKDLLNMMLQKGVFTLNHIKRSMKDYLMQRTSSVVGMVKPNGIEVGEMFRPDMFESGREPLQKEGYDLRAEDMERMHLTACRRCSAVGRVTPDCYFYSMKRCISHGWKPKIDEEAIAPVYLVEGNYRSVECYQESSAKEFDKAKLHNIVVKVADDTPGIISPMGAVIKNSDKRRALVLTGIRIVDQATLSKASSAMEALGFPPLKARITNDVTASGVNRAALCPAFRYPSLSDGIRLITPGCWIAKGDVSRYFNAFPLAKESQFYFLVRFLGIVYVSLRCVFGFGPCPYYCSTWSAEYRTWVMAEGIPSAHMVDDWLTVGSTRREASDRLNRISDIIESVGHEMQMEKREVAQSLAFLGILIDSVRMTISFDAVQAKGMQMQLQEYLDCISCGKDLDGGTIRAVAGSLNWYSEVLQSGRMHIRS